MSVHTRAVATLGPVLATVRQQRIARTVEFLREACGERDEPEKDDDAPDADADAAAYEDEARDPEVRTAVARGRQAKEFVYVDRW